jgi:hypothetical protein
VAFQEPIYRAPCPVRHPSVQLPESGASLSTSNSIEQREARRAINVIHADGINSKPRRGGTLRARSGPPTATIPVIVRVRRSVVVKIRRCEAVAEEESTVMAAGVPPVSALPIGPALPSTAAASRYIAAAGRSPAHADRSAAPTLRSAHPTARRDQGLTVANDTQTQAMLLVRGIAFLLTGLVLGGCMQSGTLALVSHVKFTTRDKQQLTRPPYQQA